MLRRVHTLRSERPPHRHGRTAITAVLITAGAAITALAGCAGMNHDHADHQAQVHDHGSMVMPFDLNKTLHSFVKTPTGGVESVVARTKTESRQAVLIRHHLQMLADDVAQGRFTDPAAIHGANMPGIKTLSAHPDRFTVAYTNIPQGGRLTFTSADRGVVAALHAWFDAQLTDHGSDATSKPVGD